MWKSALHKENFLKLKEKYSQKWDTDTQLACYVASHPVFWSKADHLDPRYSSPYDFMVDPSVHLDNGLKYISYVCMYRCSSGQEPLDLRPLAALSKAHLELFQNMNDVWGMILSSDLSLEDLVKP